MKISALVFLTFLFMVGVVFAEASAVVEIVDKGSTVDICTDCWGTNAEVMISVQTSIGFWLSIHEVFPAGAGGVFDVAVPPDCIAIRAYLHVKDRADNTEALDSDCLLFN